MKGRLRRRLLIVLCLVGVAAAFAPSGGAVQPERFFQKGTPDFVTDDPAGTVCPFHDHIVGHRQAGTFFVFSNGVIRATFNTYLQFTNVDTGKTRILHEAGTIIGIPLGGDVTEYFVEGQELSVFAPGDLGPGSPGSLPFLTGRSVEVDAEPGPNPNIFGVTTLSYQVLAGSTEDLCVTMA